MKNVLIYYRYFGLTLGGGEYLPLRFIAALQKSCAVTLALDWTDHFERAVQLMGIPIDMDRLEVVQVMPKGFHSTTNNLFQSLQRFRRLRRLAKNADVCISLANIMDFGKPAHHFLITTDLGDDGFADFVRCRGMSRPSFPMQVRRFVKDGLLRPLHKWLPAAPTYDFNTNTHGSVRPFLFTGNFEQVFPLDIYPLQLIKACIVGDLEEQEQLGIYEVEPEDFALCEFIDPSKTDIQAIVRQALETLRKEATA